MCQYIAGNNNSQFNIGKQKARTINNQFKLSDEQLSIVVAALKEQMALEYGIMRTSMEKEIVKVLDSVVKRIIAETYKEQCSSNPSVEELVITLEEFKSKATDITAEIQSIVQSQNEDKKKIRELKDLQNEINAEIKDLYRLCKDILYIIREVYAKVKELQISENEIQQLVKYYIEVAEKQSSVIVSAIKKEHELCDEILKQQRLDSSVIYEMFQVIKNLSSAGSRTEEGDGAIAAKISEQITELEDRLGKLNNMLDSTELIPEYLRYIIEKMNAVYTSMRSTGADVKRILTEVNANSDKLNEILRHFNGQAKTSINSLSNEERDQLIAEFTAQLTSSQERNKELEDIIATLKRNGAKANYPCPFCGNIPLEGRLVISGNSKCDLCGKQFVDIEPTCSSTDYRLIKLTADVQEWRNKHTAKLYRARSTSSCYAYNMNLESSTISSAGILIVPEWAIGIDGTIKEKVTQIDFLGILDKSVMGEIGKLFVPKSITISNDVKSQLCTAKSEIVMYDWDD